MSLNAERFLLKDNLQELIRILEQADKIGFETASSLPLRPLMETTIDINLLMASICKEEAFRLQARKNPGVREGEYPDPLGNLPILKVPDFTLSLPPDSRLAEFFRYSAKMMAKVLQLLKGNEKKLSRFLRFQELELYRHWRRYERAWMNLLNSKTETLARNFLTIHRTRTISSRAGPLEEHDFIYILQKHKSEVDRLIYMINHLDSGVLAKRLVNAKRRLENDSNSIHPKIGKNADSHHSN